MLQLSSAIINRPVLSLRIGRPVATATEPIINPNNLKIEGWLCEDRLSNDTLVLIAQAVRELIPQGIVVNDHEDLVRPEELVRLKETLDIHYELLGKPVITTNKRRLGKVTDYATDTESMLIEKLYVSQTLIKSLKAGNIGIGRNQIEEITSKKIVVKEPEEKIGYKSPVVSPVASSS